MDRPSWQTPATTKSPRIAGGYKGCVGAYCCVPGCTNSQGRSKRLGIKLSFYSFPRDEKQKKVWLDRVRRDVVDSCGKMVPFEPKAHSHIYSAYFVGGSRSRNPNSAAFVPSIFPRNSTTKRQTKRAEAAGVKTQTPPQSSKRKQAPVPDKPGRPKVQRTLHFPGSVWETTDHDYVKTKTSQSYETLETAFDSKLIDLEKEKKMKI